MCDENTATVAPDILCRCENRLVALRKEVRVCWGNKALQLMLQRT